jgi:hypothetical protein
MWVLVQWESIRTSERDWAGVDVTSDDQKEGCMCIYKVDLERQHAQTRRQTMNTETMDTRCYFKCDAPDAVLLSNQSLRHAARDRLTDEVALICEASQQTG